MPDAPSAIRRIANIEARLETAVEALEAALDVDEDFLRTVGLLSELGIIKSMVELQLKRVRHELAAHGATKER